MRHILYLTLLLVLVGCYEPSATHNVDLRTLTPPQRDSLLFLATHHYTNNYNFIVHADSIILFALHPNVDGDESALDTFAITRNEHVAVADIRILTTDTIDTVWVQIADEQARFGWIHEEALLDSTMPNDPIAVFITIFSSIHTAVFIVFILLVAVIYLCLRPYVKDLPVPHVRDIHSFYPTLLCMMVAVSATIYASIQMFAPDEWQHFYFFPTLNPFARTVIINLFVASLWLILILAITAIDVIYKLLPFTQATIYIAEIIALAMVNYLVFTATTYFYLGYPLLIAYLFFATRHYFTHYFLPYTCPTCGARLQRKGPCPHCGTINT